MANGAHAWCGDVHDKRALTAHPAPAGQHRSKQTRQPHMPHPQLHIAQHARSTAARQACLHHLPTQGPAVRFKFAGEPAWGSEAIVAPAAYRIISRAQARAPPPAGPCRLALPATPRQGVRSARLLRLGIAAATPGAGGLRCGASRAVFRLAQARSAGEPGRVDWVDI